MIAVSIDMPETDLRRLNSAFAKYAAYVGGDMRKAVEQTAVKMIVALRASTNASADHRRIVPNPNYKKPTEKRARQLQHIASWYAGKGKAGPVDRADYFNKYAIEQLRQHAGPRYIPVPLAQSVADAKQIAKRDLGSAYQIKRRGLAKSSWGWMLRKLGKATATTQNDLMKKSIEVRPWPTANTFGLSMVNRLDYIRKATKTNVGTAAARAAKMLEESMTGYARSAAKKAGLQRAA